MIYKFWDKTVFRYCNKCGTVYVLRQLNENKQRTIGAIEEVKKCEECCIVCPNCGKLVERVKGIRKMEFEGSLTKSGDLKLDDEPGKDDILEIYCAEREGKLEVGNCVKEVG